MEATNPIDPFDVAVDLMKKGFSCEYAREHLRLHTEGIISQDEVDAIVSEAHSLIVGGQFTRLEEIVTIHKMRYNKQIQKLLSVKDPTEFSPEQQKELTPEQFEKLRRRKIKTMNDLLDTLAQKEWLMQLHDDNFILEISSEETLTLRERQAELNVSKLTFEEQLELLEIMRGARVNQTPPLLPISQVNTGETIRDIDFEIVEETPNVQLIPQIKTPSYNNLQELSYQASDQKAALKKFKEAGATLTDEENKLIN